MALHPISGKILRGAAALAIALTLASPAFAGLMKEVNGQAYWDEDPGPIDPGTFWTSGQYKYDPDGYLDINRWDTGIHINTVIANHAGKENCVFRKRVINSSWEERNPYLRVCHHKPEQ